MTFEIAKLPPRCQNEIKNGNNRCILYIPRIFYPPKIESYFLFGPRGTGKTTWLHHFYSDALFIDLLKPAEERAFSMRPELLQERIDTHPTKKVIIIDEIQKVPQLLDVVHGLIEEKRGLQFILTGSSARKIRRAGVNLLAGRALWKRFHPFMAHEIKNQFDLQKALTFGLIPLVIESSNPQETLQSYVDLYIQEEVKAEALVRKIGEFSRFLEVMAFSHGSLVNFSNISRECEVPRKTVENFFQILQDLLLGYTIPIFGKRSKRQLSSHPKFYFFDPGVFRSLKKQGFLDLSTETDGAALKGLVIEHLRSWMYSQKVPIDLFFWRTRAGVEVDFILYSENLFFAIEVKNNKVIHSQDIKGLKAFCEDYPEATPIFLYRGNERIKKDNILCIPVDEFLLHLDPRQTSFLL